MRKRITEGRSNDRDSGKSSFSKPDYKRKEGGFGTEKRSFDKPFQKNEGFSKTTGGSDRYPKKDFKPNTFGKNEGSSSDRFPKRDLKSSTYGKPEGESARFTKRDAAGFGKGPSDGKFQRKDTRPSTDRPSDRFPKKDYKPSGTGRPDTGFSKDRFDRKDDRFPRTENRPEGGFPKRDFGTRNDNYKGGKPEGGYKPREDSRGGFERKDDRAPRTENRSDGFPKREFGNRNDNYKGAKPEGGYKPREDSRGGFERKDDRTPRTENRSDGFPKREFGGRNDNYKGARPEGGFKPREDSRGEFERKDERPNFERKAFERRENSQKPEIKNSTYGQTKNDKSAFRPNYEEDALKKKLPPKVRTKIESSEVFVPTVRLNRYLANAGLCSRRDADEFIASGQITVNGEVITEMGYQVQPTDVVKYGRKILNREKLVYVLLNKPKDFLTTTDDPEGRKTVMDLVQKACPERIYPVGRLDRATTGLLLMTNDGELAEKLSHPSNAMRKIYQAELDKKFLQEDFDKILEGIELEDGNIKADDLSIITPDRQVVGIEIHSGKNRIVRRIFESLGYEVTKLDRTTYAGLTKKDLPRGNWRFLTEKEVIRLKYLI